MSVFLVRAIVVVLVRVIRIRAQLIAGSHHAATGGAVAGRGIGKAWASSSKVWLTLVSRSN